MPALDTKFIVMAPEPTARCLDLTRLYSRLDRGVLTGIDRVELAYLDALLTGSNVIFGLLRTRAGYVLFDRTGMAAFQNHIKGKFSAKGSNDDRPSTSTVKGLAIDKASKIGLTRMLRRHLPVGSAYLNVGHSNLTNRVLRAFKKLELARVAVMLHDVIPLTHPQYQKAGSVKKFEKKIAAVQKHADLIIFNSNHSKTTATPFLRSLGEIPKSIVAHLGVSTSLKAHGDLVMSKPDYRSYFVTLGTIEPRKNHDFLLNLWEILSRQPDTPHLFIVGSRGWNNEDVFARLDVGPENITELSGRSDSYISELIAGSKGLLFPSFCEGFGLPPAEAAALGVPVVSNNLNVVKEVLGEYPIYADVADMYLWETTIRKLANYQDKVNKLEVENTVKIPFPTWEDHFKIVFSET